MWCSGLARLGIFPSEPESLCLSLSLSRSRSLSRSTGALLVDLVLLMLVPVEETGRVTVLVTDVSPIFSAFFGSGVGLPLSLGELDEIGTSGGISFGGIDLNPGLFAESRPDSFETTGLFLFSTEPGFSADLSPSFFSSGGIIDLEGDGSLPILLHVWARRARGLFFASSWKEKSNDNYMKVHVSCHVNIFWAQHLWTSLYIIRPSLKYIIVLILHIIFWVSLNMSLWYSVRAGADVIWRDTGSADLTNLSL